MTQERTFSPLTDTNCSGTSTATSSSCNGGLTFPEQLPEHVSLTKLLGCSMCETGLLCGCGNMRISVSEAAVACPLVELPQNELSLPSTSSQILINTTTELPVSTSYLPSIPASDQQDLQNLLFTNATNLLPFTKPDGTNKVTRKCVRCKCPNCLSGQKGTSDKPKQHICHIPSCGKVYGKTSHLKAHLLFHAGQRPFACNWRNCNRSFTRSDELQRHLRTHTGEKRFGCEECGKRFTRSDHLSKHMQTHRKNKEVKCK